MKRQPTFKEIMELLERIEQAGVKISNFTAEPKQDGTHVFVSIVMPWVEVESK